MSLQLRVLCRPELAAGFALTGLPVIGAEGAADASIRFRELLDDSSIGIVLMEEPMYEHLSDELRRQLARRPLPMVVPFPGIEWEVASGAAESYIVELLRRVIGYRVRLR